MNNIKIATQPSAPKPRLELAIGDLVALHRHVLHQSYSETNYYLVARTHSDDASYVLVSLSTGARFTDRRSLQDLADHLAENREYVVEKLLPGMKIELEVAP